MPDYLTDLLGRPYLPRRDNAKGAQRSQEWQSAPGYAGRNAPGVMLCGVCKRPLPSWGDQVPGPNSDRFGTSGRDDGDYRKYLGWAWKIATGKQRPGRPQEYHPECSLFLRDMDRFKKAIQAVVFADNQAGDDRISDYRSNLTSFLNSRGGLGPGRYSEGGRKSRFGRRKKKI